MSLYLAFGLLMMTSVSPSSDKNATLEITINNVKNDDGYMLISLFDAEDGFPDESEKAFKIKKIKAEAGQMKVTFENIPHGIYAIAVLHDQNNNGKLDKNLVGIPLEGYGSSNNQKKLFRAPNFEECQFKVEDSTVASPIFLNY